jgi:hypothetical protein
LAEPSESVGETITVLGTKGALAELLVWLQLALGPVAMAAATGDGQHVDRARVRLLQVKQHLDVLLLQIKPEDA